MRRHLHQMMWAIGALSVLAACATTVQQTPLSGMAQRCYDGDTPQTAALADMHAFDPFVGRFRTPTQLSDEGIEYHHILENAWYDASQTTIKLTMYLVVPSQSRMQVVGEGYYGHDAFNQRLYVVAVFSGAPNGFGTVGRFDRAARTRETWGCQLDENGVVTRVRDSFAAIDENSFRNITRVRRGDDPEWGVFADQIMTRVAE